MNFAIWELRNGLEADESDMAPDSISIANKLDLFATEWTIQSGLQLLRESLLNSVSNQLEHLAHGILYGGGILYSGIRGFNLERWGIWKGRQIKARKDVGKSIGVLIDEAVDLIVV